jgi:hypothetical protein
MMMRTIRIAMLVAGSVVLISGCGSSNSKLSYSAFSDAAGKICTTAGSQIKAAGNGATQTANAASATALGKALSVSQKAISQLKALSGPGSLQSARDAFAANLSSQNSSIQSAITAAKSGNQSAYVAAIKSVAVADQQGNLLGSKLGAAGCAKT